MRNAAPEETELRKSSASLRPLFIRGRPLEWCRPSGVVALFGRRDGLDEEATCDPERHRQGWTTVAIQPRSHLTPNHSCLLLMLHPLPRPTGTAGRGGCQKTGLEPWTFWDLRGRRRPTGVPTVTSKASQTIGLRYMITGFDPLHTRCRPQPLMQTSEF